MEGVCLYLPLILLMRSGDVETNPGPNPTDSVEWEGELLQLAERIQPAKYMRIGNSLGVRHAQLQTIMKEQLNNNTNALMAVFMIWNNETLPGVNKRDVLADKLKESGLLELSDKIRNGNLDANLTEEPQSTEPQNKQLSAALIEQCRNDFKFKYRSSLCKIRSDPLDPNSVVKYMYMYTDLVLKEEHYKGGRPEKKPLTYTEFVKITVDRERRRRLMVEGEAGAGKTTFCAQIAWDWINGKYFQEFDLVLIVPLRLCKRYTLGEIAKSYLTKNNPTTAHQLTEYIRSNPDKVFIACDGLDEFSGNVEQLLTEGQQTQSVDQSMQSTSSASRPTIGNSGASENSLQSCEMEMADILYSEELETCPVLVTSRPWKAKEIKSNSSLAKLYTFFHIKGFSADGLSDYIHKFFPDNDAKADRLIKLTKDSDVIAENMAHYPLYVAIICLMWREISDQKVKEMESFQTFSQVFGQMFRFLKEHFAQKEIKNVASKKFREYLIHINKCLEPVSKLALTGLLANKLVFDESDFQDCPKSLEIACRVGILSQENTISSMFDDSPSHLQPRVFFPHKLFQEYMAGIHLASILEFDCDEFERLMGVILPRGEEFRYLLYFAASRNKEVGINVMKCMVGGLNERTGLLVDVAFECNHPEAVAVVHQKVHPTIQLFDTSDMTAHTIAAYKSIGIDPVDMAIEGNFNQSSSHDIARIVCSSPSLETLDIRGSFHDDFFKILQEQAERIQAQTVLIFTGFGSFEDRLWRVVSRLISQKLAETLASMPNLYDLALQVECVYDEFFSVLKEKATILKVQALTLSSTQVTDYWEDTDGPFPSLTSTADDDLAEAVSSMPELTHLTLDLVLQDTLFEKIIEKIESCESCFPGIARGNFIFNGVLQRDMEMFLNTLRQYESEERNWFSQSENSLSQSENSLSQSENSLSQSEEEDEQVTP